MGSQLDPVEKRRKGKLVQLIGPRSLKLGEQNNPPKLVTSFSGQKRGRRKKKLKKNTQNKGKIINFLSGGEEKKSLKAGWGGTLIIRPLLGYVTDAFPEYRRPHQNCEHESPEQRQGCHVV